MKKIVISLLVIVLLFSFISCGNKTDKENVKDTKVSVTETEASEVAEQNGEDSSPETEEIPMVNAEDYVEPVPDASIETPHFNFSYFNEWSSDVKFESVTAENGNYEVRCYGVGKIEGFHCFSIIFGNCDGLEDHHFIGEYTKDGTTVKVYTYVNQKFDSLSDEQKDIVSNTVHSGYMNELTFQIQDDPGFITNH